MASPDQAKKIIQITHRANLHKYKLWEGGKILKLGRYSVMLVGKHGVGKDDLTWDVSKEMFGEMNKESGYPVCVDRLRPANIDPSDIMGIPHKFKDEKYSEQCKKTIFRHTFTMNDWFLMDNNIGCTLFINEVLRGQMATLNALFRLIYDYDINGSMLGKNVIIVGATNPANSESGYYATNMCEDQAFVDRWIWVNLKPTIYDWLKWANIQKNKGLFDEDIINWVSDHNDVIQTLNSTSDFELKIETSGRSMDKWNFIKSVMTKEEFREVGRIILEGIVGSDLAVRFFTYLTAKYDKSLTAEQILNHLENHLKQIEKWTAIGENKQKTIDYDTLAVCCNNVQLYLETIEKNLTVKQEKNLTDFLKLLPADSIFAFFSKCQAPKLIKYSQLIINNDELEQKIMKVSTEIELEKEKKAKKGD